MKRVFLSTLVTLLICLCIPALSEGGDPPTAPDLYLRGNPMTGYEWLYQVEDDSILAVTDNGYQQDEAAEGLTGAGGTFCFRLDGVKSGMTRVSFRYARAWENEVSAPAVTYDVLVDDELNVMIFGNEIDLGA